jgi:hypothetical protein
LASLLDLCPSGRILDAPQPAGHERDYSDLLHALVDGLTPAQRRVFDTPHRFRMVCAGRRFGKTHLSLVQLLSWAIEKPGSLNWYIAPTYRAAKSIAWRGLKQMVPRDLFLGKNETELTVELVNGSRIELKGGEAADNLRGSSLSNVVLDEAAYIPRDAWEMVIRPALSDQQGSAYFISTPAGLNHFAEWWEQAEEQDDWTTFSFSTLEGGNVPPEEVEAARRTLDARTFSQEYEASFVNLVGRVVPDFGDENITDEIEDLGGELLLAADYNVSPMHWIICQKVADQLHCIDELHLKETHTDEACTVLLDRYPGRKFRAYPDPTGHARRTSSGGQTDHGIMRLRGIWVSENKRPYGQDDKRNAVNSMVLDASGRRRLFVHPRCKQTIKSLRNLTYKEGTNMPDKQSGFDHGWDAISYLIIGVFDPVAPWKATAGQKVRGIRLY